MSARGFTRRLAAAALLLALASCGRSSRDAVQGYVEGEYVYVASPLAGAEEALSVQRGAQVKAGDPLFSLESGAEAAARAQAQKRLEEGRASLEDARKGKRPPEIESLEAQLRQAHAALALSEKEFARDTALFRTGAASAEELDKGRSARDQDQHRTAQLEADLTTAQLGSRTDQIAAAESNVRALEAALARADWDLHQKRQTAPLAGLVFDTLFQTGEWVPAGRPVVVLLPPENIKVRVFVPEARVGSIQPSQRVRVTVDGIAEPYDGKVSYISPHAEYTPPVIYSQESRGKLVFMVEISFERATAAKLHPGQPVDAHFEG